MKRIILVDILFFIFTYTHSQNTISGTLPNIANQKIQVLGYSGFNTYVIDSVKVNEVGGFNLSYSVKDYGMGYLSTQTGKSFLIVLSGEDVILKGEKFEALETINFIEGTENKLFKQYAEEHPRREQVLSAWQYIYNIYSKDSLFAVQKTIKKSIGNELQRIKEEDNLFLTNLKTEYYLSWYLPLRKLVSSVSTIAQYRTDEIPETIENFRNINYTDHRLQKSGLLANVIESHFFLIENSGLPLDSVYAEMNTSIDILIENLLSDELILNDITEYLFNYLEKRSLSKASEYLALKILNMKECTINNVFAAQLESYRAMSKGNIAPDFVFNNNVVAPGYKADEIPKRLSDLKSKYTVLVFGASWCPQCPQELIAISELYDKWRKQEIEVIFISLDENVNIFEEFTAIFPFISLCDFNKWESSIVKKYHVFATPTIYLLDNKREILLRPSSVKQIDSWIDWYLVQ